MSTRSKWKYSLKGARNLSQRCPIVFGNLVLATFNYGEGCNFHGTLCAIDIETGEEKWRFEVDHYLNEPNISDDGHVFTTCFNGSVFKLQLNGELCWQSQPSQRNTWKGLIIKDKFIYPEIAGGAKYTRALNTANGSVIWEYENGGHSYALASNGVDRIVHCSVCGGFKDKCVYLHCLDANSGNLLWRSEHDQYLFRPLIIDNYIFIGSRNHVALFDLVTGELLAKHKIEDGIAVTAKPIKQAKAGVVFLTEKGRLFCVEIVGSKNPQLKQFWSCDLSSEVEAKVILHGENLLVITEAGDLVTVNGNTGQIINRISLSGFKKGYGLAPVGNNLIVSVSRYCSRLQLEI